LIYSPAVYQLEVFGEALAMGLALGILIDGYRVLRGLVAPPVKVTHLVDFIFWCVITAVFVTVLMTRFWGELYAYSYLGLALGYLLYFYLLGDHFVFFWSKLFGIIFRAVNLIFNPALKVVAYLVQKISIILRQVAGFILNLKNTS